VLYFDRGEIGTAIEVAAAARRLAEQAGFSEGLNQADFDLILIYSYLGDLPRALGLAQALRARVAAKAGEGYHWPGLDGLLAWLHLLSGQQAEAQTTLSEAGLGVDLSNVQMQFMSELMMVGMAVADLALAQGDAGQALNLADQVIGALRATSTRLFLADVLMLRARALEAAGRAAEAEAAWNEAASEAEALGSRRTLWQVLAGLARLAEARGETVEAAARWREAAGIVNYVTAHTGSALLADSFRARAEVREVLGKATDSP